jgi:hypothetical protein
VGIDHTDAPPDADGSQGLSGAQVVAATSLTDPIEVTIECEGETSRGEGTAGDDGIVRIDLALYAMTPCRFTGLRVGGQDGDPAWLDLGDGFDVGPDEAAITEQDIRDAFNQLAAQTGQTAPTTAAPAPEETTGPGTVTTAPETVDAFVAQLVSSLSSGDPSFAVDRLHPTVLSAFPTQCPAHLDSVTDPTFDIQVTEVSQPGDYVYAPPSLGGVQYTVPNVIALQAQVTTNGTTAPQELHVADVDGTYRWFTDCGP